MECANCEKQCNYYYKNICKECYERLFTRSYTNDLRTPETQELFNKIRPLLKNETDINKIVKVQEIILESENELKRIDEMARNQLEKECERILKGKENIA